MAKLNPTGALVYATYLGNAGSSWNLVAGTGIAVDAAGDAYVIGSNAGVPTTANAIASSAAYISQDGTDFVAELNPTGSGLLYGTYLPGTVNCLYSLGYTAAIAVDGTGNIDVAGAATTGLPTTAGAFQTAYVGESGNNDAFFAKINPALSGTASLVYASYLGGGESWGDAATGIALDGAGNAYLEGYAGSTDFPTTSGAFQTSKGGGLNVFVAKFDPALSGTASLVYSTYLGGSTGSGGENWGAGYVPDVPVIDSNQISGGIAVDSAGNAYVTSATTFTNFPTTAGAYQTTSNMYQDSNFSYPASDVFVTKLNASGNALVYSTYLGGGTNGGKGDATHSGGASIAVDASGDAYVTGWTDSTSFPTLNAVQATNGGGYNNYGEGMDSFVTELNPSGSGLLFSTYLGGSGDDFGYCIAVDSAGNVYVGGSSFVAKINLAPSPSFAVTGPSGVTAGTADSLTLTALNADGTADTGYSGTVQITSSDPKAVLPGNLAISGGTGTFNVTLETAGTQSVTATDIYSPITGLDAGIAVSPAAASQVVFTQEPSSGTAGKTLGTVEATIEDAYGNVETGDNSDQVTLSVNSGPSTQLGGTLTETVQAGNAIFSNLLLDTSGSYTLAALANLAGGGTLGPVVSSSFTVASPVSLSFGSITYNSRTKLYSETVTLTNTTSGTLTGPMSLELTNLPSGVVLTDATGTTNGNPYVRFLTSGKTLRKGASTSITLTFTAASLSDITFGTEVVVGL